MYLFYACSSTYFDYRGNSRRSQLHVLKENNTRFVNEGFIVITISSEHSRGNKTKGYGLGFNCDNEYTVVLCNNLYFVYCTRKTCMVILIFDFCLLYYYRINRYFIMLQTCVSLLKNLLARLFCRCHTNDECQTSHFLANTTNQNFFGAASELLGECSCYI